MMTMTPNLPGRPLRRAAFRLAALAVAATLAPAARADLSWAHIADATHPQAAYAEDLMGLDVGAKYQGNFGRACFANCMLAELRARAVKGPSAPYTAEAGNMMGFALKLPNGNPPAPGDLVALGAMVLRFRVEGKHQLPPAAGAVAFSHRVMVTPAGGFNGAGQSYEGRNEVSATGGRTGQWQFVKYLASSPVPTVTQGSNAAEMDGWNFDVEIRPTDSGTLEWAVTGGVEQATPSFADYRIVLKQVMFTAQGLPGLSLELGQGGGSGIYRLQKWKSPPDGGPL